MSLPADPKPRRGAALPLFVIFVLIAGAGAALDLLAGVRPSFWMGAAPGWRTAIGLSAALVAALAALMLRAALARRSEEGGHDGNHP